MNYETAETEIVTRLNAQIAANGKSALYEAALFPETEAEFNIFYSNFSKARAAVQFIDAQPLQSNALGNVTQDEIIKFRLSFEAKKLRGVGGLYAMMQLVKLVLIGWTLTDATSPLTWVKYGLLEFEQNNLQPMLEFECKAVNVQAFSTNPDDLPLSGTPIVVSFPTEV